jgi:hypothetical protein
LRIGLACAGLWLVTFMLIQPWRGPLEDFVEYWAAGRANLEGENPYDAATLYRYEHAVSPGLTDPIMMWNPPWTLTVAMPFAMLPVRAGFAAWLAVHVLLIAACADGLWRYFGGPARLRWLAWALAAGFVPVFFALRMGQISPLLLAGVVGFLCALTRGKEGRAGAALALAWVKPQLVYLFGLGVLLWSWRERRWRILIGAAAALGGLSLWPVVVNPPVLHQYHAAITQQPPKMLSPTPGALLRLVFGLDKLWLQYVPVALGLCWLAWHWRRHRQDWTWREEAPVLLLASMLTASYGAWPFDLVLLLVPVTQAAVWVATRRAEALLAVPILLAFDVLALLTQDVHWAEQYRHAWMTPMFLYGYLALRRRRAAEPAGVAALAEA